MRIPTESTQRGHDITIRDFNYNIYYLIYIKKCFIQKLQHIRRIPSSCVYPSIYMRIYERNYCSAHGHELSGCVHANAYNLILIFALYNYIKERKNI